MHTCINDLLVVLVVVLLVKVGFDDVDTEDTEEVNERWSLAIELLRREKLIHDEHRIQ